MRYMRMLVHGHWLAGLFATGHETKMLCVEGLPTGSRFVYSIPDVNYGIWCVFEHESFRELHDGEEIPILKSPIMNSL